MKASCTRTRVLLISQLLIKLILLDRSFQTDCSGRLCLQETLSLLNFKPCHLTGFIHSITLATSH